MVSGGRPLTAGGSRSTIRADGSELAQFAAATEADCLAAVDAAADALTGWAATPPRERSEMLRRRSTS